MALEGINGTAWGTKLLLIAVFASPVDSTSLCHIQKATPWGLNNNIQVKCVTMLDFSVIDIQLCNFMLRFTAYEFWYLGFVI